MTENATLYSEKSLLETRMSGYGDLQLQQQASTHNTTEELNTRLRRSRIVDAASKLKCRFSYKFSLLADFLF